MPLLRSGRSTPERGYESATPSAQGEDQGEDAPRGAAAAFEARAQAARKGASARARRGLIRPVLRRGAGGGFRVRRPKQSGAPDPGDPGDDSTDGTESSEGGDPRGSGESGTRQQNRGSSLLSGAGLGVPGAGPGLTLEVAKPSSGKAPHFDGTGYSLWSVCFESWATVQGMWHYYAQEQDRPPEVSVNDPRPQ